MPTYAISVFDSDNFGEFGEYRGLSKCEEWSFLLDAYVNLGLFHWRHSPVVSMSFFWCINGSDLLCVVARKYSTSPVDRWHKLKQNTLRTACAASLRWFLSCACLYWLVWYFVMPVSNCQINTAWGEREDGEWAVSCSSWFRH